MIKTILFSLLCLFYIYINQAISAQIRIAVASNFSPTIKVIARNFEALSGHKVLISSGSTGRHYAQIKNGAPFDAFFAADSKRPQLLDDEGLIQASSRFTYALGKLVLWSPKEFFFVNKIQSAKQLLSSKKFNYLAIANPKLAPYGKAAEKVLQHFNLWASLHKKTVRGENIAQAFQFVKTEHAELGFIAFSQVKNPYSKLNGSYWEVPQSLYPKIEQQAVLLSTSPVAQSFFDYIKTPESANIIKNFSYGLP